MRPLKDWDVWVYLGLFAGLGIYAFYLRQTCEEIGCLAIIVPLILIGIFSIIEFFVSLFTISKRREASALRIIFFLISGLITLFVLSFAIFAVFNG